MITSDTDVKADMRIFLQISKISFASFAVLLVIMGFLRTVLWMSPSFVMDARFALQTNTDPRGIKSGRVGVDSESTYSLFRSP